MECSAANIPSYVTPAMARRHPASLMPKFMHDPALLELVRAPVTAEMICTHSLSLLLVRCLAVAHTILPSFF